MSRYKATSKDEYYRIRDNIARRARYFRKKGYIPPELPFTPKQWGQVNVTSRQYEEYIKELETFEEMFNESIQRQRRQKGIEYAPYDEVVLSNFRKNLQTKTYAKGASKIEQWFDDTQKRIGKAKTAEVITKAQQDGVEVDRFTKYGSDEHAMQYIADMSRYLYQEELLSEDELKEMLEDASYIDEEYSRYFDDFMEGLQYED